MQKVTIHTDGGCHGNPGPGGWAATLACGKHKLELSGGEPATTNNRMELQAAIAAFSSLKEACTVEFYTDSNYVKNGVTTWIFGWKKNGWMTKARQPVKNDDLWRLLDAAIQSHSVQWHWVKGHSGHSGNERCDELATLEIEKIKTQYTRSQLKELCEQMQAKATSSAEVLFGA